MWGSCDILVLLEFRQSLSSLLLIESVDIGIVILSFLVQEFVLCLSGNELLLLLLARVVLFVIGTAFRGHTLRLVQLVFVLGWSERGGIKEVDEWNLELTP